MSDAAHALLCLAWGHGQAICSTVRSLARAMSEHRQEGGEETWKEQVRSSWFDLVNAA